MLITTALLDGSAIDEAIEQRRAAPYMGWLLDIIKNAEPNHTLPAPSEHHDTPGDVQCISSRGTDQPCDLGRDLAGDKTRPDGFKTTS